MENEVQSMAEEKQNKKKKSDLATQLTGVAVLAVIALGIVKVVNTGITVSGILDERDEVIKSMNEITIPEYQEPAGTQVEEDSGFVFEVARQGDDVAEAQNIFLSVFAEEEPGSEAYLDRLEEAKALMRPQFEEGAGSWYMAGDNAEGKELTWEFVGGYDMPDKVSSVWLLKDRDNRLVAYTVSEYGEDSGKFYGPQCVMTEYGRTLSSEADEPDYMEKYSTGGEEDD